MSKNFLFFLCFVMVFSSCYAQEDATLKKNQIATNLILPLLESVDLSYERTIANKWALGIAAAIYGEDGQDLSTSYSNGYDLTTTYEVMPFVRIYFQGAQNKSHFLEVFGSLSRMEERGAFIRNTNEQGFGVYERGVRDFTVGGLGIGYGYRFLLLEKKLVLEAQFGIRTNFDVEFFFLNAALVRTGIKVGYRF
jgi:hypothetical protein